VDGAAVEELAAACSLRDAEIPPAELAACCDEVVPPPALVSL